MLKNKVVLYMVVALGLWFIIKFWAVIALGFLGAKIFDLLTDSHYTERLWNGCLTVIDDTLTELKK